MLLCKIKENYILIILCFIGIFVRIIALDSLPKGVNQDEAYIAYEAFSLLNFGIDSHGYHNPVYFTVWGSGCSVLYSYLIMFFAHFLGFSIFVVRLPQVVCGILSIFIFYKFLLLIKDKRTAIVGTFILVINPWHIMMCRWGLDANLLPFFLLTGMYFMVLSKKNEIYLICSAISYGLSLYCYATIWPIIPILIIGEYMYINKKIKITHNLMLSVVILFLFALPLLLFLLINYDFISEINIFISIPKLPGFRSNDISIHKIPENFMRLLNLLVSQNDYLPHNQIYGYGMYYKIGGVFALVGLVSEGKEYFQSKDYKPEIVVLINLIMAIILGCIIEVNINRINIIHFPIIYYSIIGLIKLIENFSLAGYSCIVYLIIQFLMFTNIYFTIYQEEYAKINQYGLEEALEYANQIVSINGEKICVSRSSNYSRILYYSKVPPRKFIDTVNYINYPSPWLDVSSFDNYIYGINFENLSSDYVYVVEQGEFNKFDGKEFSVEQFDNYFVIYEIGN